MNALSSDTLNRFINAVVLTLSLAVVHGVVYFGETPARATHSSTDPLTLAEEVKIHCPKRSRIHLVC